MARRTPGSPPAIAGYTPVELIGTGGYADVFLYQQHAPRRLVAIKVMAASTLSTAMQHQLFDSEANLMARVSAHPYIVQVFDTGTAADGRLYLIMEYYPGPNFLDRARRERFSVHEALRVGVQLAGAIETAHRAGIVHRDIKPANVLTSEYNRPGLTDFGIASTQGPGEQADGVSIPWAAPEALGDADTDERADVYALGATVYDLLAGRSPFEIVGGDNSELALLDRIERQPLPPTGRPDVPPALERVLAHAMQKRPEHRPQRAAELGRALQAIESELNLAVTQLELPGDGPVSHSRNDQADGDDERTRLRGVVRIDAQGPAVIDAVGDHPVDATVRRGAAPRTRTGMLSEPPLADTAHVVRAPVSPPPTPGTGTDRRLVIAALGVLALVGAIIGAVVLSRGGTDRTDPIDSDIAAAEVNAAGANPQPVTPPSVAQITATANPDGTYRFSWEAPAAELSYAVTEDGAGAPVRIETTSFVSTSTCIEVESIGSNGVISAPTRGCA